MQQRKISAEEKLNTIEDIFNGKTSINEAAMRLRLAPSSV